MFVRLLVLSVLAADIYAQTRLPSDINVLVRNVRSAIDKDNLMAASDFAARLQEAVEQQYRTWLVRDARQRVDEILTWLPEDTEALIVNQEPFVIDAKDSIRSVDGHPARQYTTDRLMAANAGKFYSDLAGVTVRLIAAGIRDIRDLSEGSAFLLATPAPMPNAEVFYFFLLADPADPAILGVPTQTIEGHPAWLGKAIRSSEAGIPATEHTTREDATWLVLAKRDLLVISNSSEALGQVLGRMARGSQAAALPPTLPEWAEVDRTADFWGLRHYSDPGDRKDTSNPRANANPQGQRDPTAIGVAVRLYSETRDLEIRYLSNASRLPRFIDDPPTPLFKTEHERPGLWRVTCNIHDRGDFPFHVAARLLGFGEYH